MAKMPMPMLHRVGCRLLSSPYLCVASHTQVGCLDRLPGLKDGAVSAKRGPLESGWLLGITSARPWVLASQTVLRRAKAMPDHQNAHSWMRVWEWEASSGQGCFALWLSARGKTSPPSPLSSPSNEMWPRLVRPAGLTIVGRQLDKRAFKPRRWSRLVAKAQYRVQGLGIEGCMLIDWAAGLTLARPSERWSVVSPARCFAVCAQGRQRRRCTAVSRHIETRDGQSDEEGVSGRLLREREGGRERDRKNCGLPFTV